MREAVSMSTDPTFRLEGIMHERVAKARSALFCSF